MYSLPCQSKKKKNQEFGGLHNFSSAVLVKIRNRRLSPIYNTIMKKADQRFQTGKQLSDFSLCADRHNAAKQQIGICRAVRTCHCEPARTLVWQSPSNSGQPIVIQTVLLHRFPESGCLLSRNCTSIQEIATPVCALARNDREFDGSSNSNLYFCFVTRYAHFVFPDCKPMGNISPEIAKDFLYSS